MSPRRRLVQIRLKEIQYRSYPSRKLAVLQTHVQFVVGNLTEHCHCVVIEILPAARREFLKDFLGLLVPSPPEIASQPVQSDRQFCQLTRRQRSVAHSQSSDSDTVEHRGRS